MAMYFVGASPSLSLTLRTDPFCGFSAFPDERPIEGLQRYCSSEFTGKKQLQIHRKQFHNSTSVVLGGILAGGT